MPNANNDARSAASEFAAGLSRIAQSPEPATTGFRAALLESRIDALLDNQQQLLEAIKSLMGDLALFRGQDHETVAAARRLVLVTEMTRW